MAQKRFQIETTLYGKRLVTRQQLYELHREVSRAASLARLSDPEYVEVQKFGYEASRAAHLRALARHGAVR
jgi:hypothetical protein